jgi:hypothetical protein
VEVGLARRVELHETLVERAIAVEEGEGPQGAVELPRRDDLVRAAAIHQHEPPIDACAEGVDAEHLDAVHEPAHPAAGAVVGDLEIVYVGGVAREDGDGVEEGRVVVRRGAQEGGALVKGVEDLVREEEIEDEVGSNALATTVPRRGSAAGSVTAAPKG